LAVLGIFGLFRKKERSDVQVQAAAPAVGHPATPQPRRDAGRECWVPAKRAVTVGSFTLPGGMLYFGRGLSSVGDAGSVEPALINPGLPIERFGHGSRGEGMPYWPSYSEIGPAARTGFLQWLASGRNDPSAYIGFVFLFFYGLERRLLADSESSPAACGDAPEIAVEVERLLSIYGGNQSFRSYATSFLDLIRYKFMHADCKDLALPMQSLNGELPFSLKAGLARLVAEGKAIPADWALSVLYCHPNINLRTPATRCAREFADLFWIRYAESFGDGLRVQPNKTRLSLRYHPASPTFHGLRSGGGEFILNLDLPDVSRLSTPVTKFREIAERCCDELDPYSRLLGKRPEAVGSAEAAALLPKGLMIRYAAEQITGLRGLVKSCLGGNSRGVMAVERLLGACRIDGIDAVTGTGKLPKAKSVVILQLLEKMGYGIEPDVRFGGPALCPGQKIVMFRVEVADEASPSPESSMARLLMHLAVLVMQADGEVAPEERRQIQRLIQDSLKLGDGERRRLEAYVEWLLAEPPALRGLKRQIEKLDQGQRSFFCKFLVQMALADGRVDPSEVVVLSKAYRLMGLDPGDVHRHIHEMSLQAVPPAVEPVTVMERGDGGPAFSIPAPPEPASDAGQAAPVRLDLEMIQIKTRQSDAVFTLLQGIFEDEDDAQPAAVGAPVFPSGSETESIADLDLPHTRLLRLLVGRPEWSRLEYEDVVRGLGLLPDAALAVLNEAVMDQTGAPLCDGEDPIEIDAEIAKELLP
jgi:uncharacterized tellurite resistance protein B-like protein